jgi:hypothetical protein
MLYESSLTGLFRFLLVAFLVYYAFTFIVRYILPPLLKNSIRNFYKGYYEEDSHSYEDKRSKDGEVTIEYLENSKNRSAPYSDDEYVDYEEIK